MDQRKKVGELISMNSQRPGIIHIYEEEQITIGRLEENTNPIFDNRIAPHHCSIQFQDGQVVLKNLTTQGTYLNKEKMGLNLEVNLEHGDHIHLLCQKGKKVPEKHVIAYMFFKHENKKQSARKQSKRSQPLLELISDDLICSICTQIYYEGVAVSPCGHVFCGHCLEQWEQQQYGDSCPICRLKMRNITKAFQINKIISTFLEVNPDVEQNKKPSNKYFLQAAQNDEQNVDDSDISISDDQDSDFENIEIEVVRRIQQDAVLRRQFNNINIADLLALNNQQQQIRQQNLQGIQQPRIPQAQQIQQPQPVIQRIQQPHNIQQNQQPQQNPLQNPQQNPQQNAYQNAQQNVQGQNLVLQNAQRQNGQAQIRQIQNGQAYNGQAQNVQVQNVQNPVVQNEQARNVQIQNAQAQNGQAMNAYAPIGIIPQGQANQQRVNLQPPQQNPQINVQRANNPPNNNLFNNPPPIQQRPPINVQANQQYNQPYPNQQIAQLNQIRANIPPVIQAYQPRASPILYQAAYQHQQRANPPSPAVAPFHHGQLFHALPNTPQNQVAQHIQVRVNRNPPPQQIVQAPPLQNQVLVNIRQDQQVQPLQRQPQNQIPQIVQPQRGNMNQPY